MNKDVMLIANGFVSIPESTASDGDVPSLATVLSNLAYFGYTLAPDALKRLEGFDKGALATFWKPTQAALKEITGTNRNMDRFVVYKNFPKEVLDKSAAEYWIAQILMYWGLPNEYVTQPEEDRAELAEKIGSLKVLRLANADTPADIFAALMRLRARWTDPQKEWAESVFAEQQTHVDIGAFGFKENALHIATLAFKQGLPVTASAATDVLRLGASLSGGDVSLREKTRFATLPRAQRKRLVEMLTETSNLTDDFAARPEMWKRFLHMLHPGDFTRDSVVSAAYNGLYNGTLRSHGSKIETGLRDRAQWVLPLLAERPGDFARRLHHVYATFGTYAFEVFIDTALPKLKTIQLLKLDRYLLTANDREHFVYAPNGNWGKAQVALNANKVRPQVYRAPTSRKGKEVGTLYAAKARIQDSDLRLIREAISKEVGRRVNAAIPEGVTLDMDVDQVRLQTGDQKLASYGRGTSFLIPEKASFIRSASFWACASTGMNIWYDNGWNFFDASWNSMGACCWDTANLPAPFGGAQAAVFSGDPTSSKDMKGRACQMIDLNLDRLKASGVRYAVWSILCYSRVSFNQAEDVLATLQWGEDPQKGNLYEPSRAQMVFPVKGDNLTKFIAYIDLETRKLIYVDANLRGQVGSANSNCETLATLFPAFLEHLDSTVPTVAELFVHAKAGPTPILYSDADEEVSGKAYVFRRENAQNTFKSLDLTVLLD